MTIRIPKWLLWTLLGLLVVAAVAAAFLLGQSSGDSETVVENVSNGESTAAEVQEAPCTEQAAKKATLAAGLDQLMQETGEAESKLGGYKFTDLPGSNGSPFFDDYAGFYPGQLECGDLTGDGVDEMVFSIAGGASGHVFNWLIFTPTAEGEWEAAFVRNGVPVSDLKIRGNTVSEREPAYLAGEATCCPSGHRTTEIAYKGGEFQVVSPTASSAERLLNVSSSGVQSIGDFDPNTGDVGQATVVFGLPSSTVATGEACRVGWDDLGLTIVFANYGGGDVCSDGAVASVEVSGLSGRQAGWHTPEGAKVGMSVGELRRIYPQAASRRGALWLINMPSPFGEGGTTPALSAFTSDGTAWAFRLYVGAAGE